ncbi:zinc transporter ZIP1-like [Bombyx mandarina]|uniref:Uncharacterized protein n=2 Tax=Bombyx TaxID=7090 RepID=A0A8R2AEL6_BOMMO|nr:zinc transporter ZIP1 [Bombyx mori]XP_028036663.1 zinc transporter ZIP1-like [Bombyx mandarina]
MAYRHSHDHDDDTDGIVLAKGISMVVLFCASMICGLIPQIIARKFRWLSVEDAGTFKSTNRVVMTLLSFGGGVLLSTTFMHVMPEVQENIENLQARNILQEFDFSLTPLLTCCGFFIMYLIEELVHIYIHHREKNNGQTDLLVRNLSVRKSRCTEGHSNEAKNSTESGIESPEKNREHEANNHNHAKHHSHMPIQVGDDVTSALRGLLIVLALSVHELFEGLAVGLENSTSHVWYMLGAVSAHKLVIAFCIGVELIATRTKTWLTIVYITTFAFVSPLGIGIGLILVGGEGAATQVASAVLQGLASGTLVYVIFFEIWKGDRSGILQYIASLFGFFLMFGLQLLTGHSHSHSHGGGDGDHGHSHDR